MKRKHFLIGTFLIIAAIAGALLVYPQLPQTIPTSWNAQGTATEWVPKWTLLVGMPALMIAMLGLFPLLAWISRRRFPVEGFVNSYYFLMLALIALFAYFQLLLLWGAVSHIQGIGTWVWSGIFVALGLVGNIMGKLRRNLLVGLRVPWTLNKEPNWIRGNRLAGYIMVAVAFVGLALTIARVSEWILFALIALGVAGGNIYSLLALTFMRRLKH